MLRFNDILGQRRVIDWLRAALSEDHLPHAMIFAGPQGVGKATTARALATLFLCENPADAEPCARCENCRAMETGVHPDFHVIYRQLVRLEKTEAKAKELSIDVVRQFLIAPAGLKPGMNRGKFFLVEEADRMNPEAQNAILKTLEEPPGRTLIVLLTDQPHALLPTIRSRCQVLRFSSLDEKVVQGALRQRDVNAKDATDAAAMAHGSLGLAIRWLQDGVIARGRELLERLESIASGSSATDLPAFLKESAEGYADAQLQRDPLASKDQAIREGIATYLSIAANHLRLRIRELADADQIEQTCTAIDACVKSEEYLEANVNVPLVLQQFVLAVENSLVPRQS